MQNKIDALMGKLEDVAGAVQEFWWEVSGSAVTLAETVKDIAIGENKVVYVASFWRLDDESGYEWSVDRTLIEGLYGKWVAEIKGEPSRSGVVGLFKVVVPNGLSVQEYVKSSSHEDWASEIEINSYRQNMGTETGF